MKLAKLRLSGLQCFAPSPSVEIDFQNLIAFIGLHGVGKTAAIAALARMFGVDRRMHGLRPTDFFMAPIEERTETVLRLWIEADFIFSELEGAAPSKHISRSLYLFVPFDHPGFGLGSPSALIPQL